MANLFGQTAGKKNNENTLFQEPHVWRITFSGRASTYLHTLQVHPHVSIKECAPTCQPLYRPTGTSREQPLVTLRQGMPPPATKTRAWSTLHPRKTEDGKQGEQLATPANPEWPSPWPEGDQLEKAPGSGRASAELAQGAHVRDLGQAWLLHSCHEVQHQWIFLLPTTSEHLPCGFWGYCTLLPRSTQTSTDPNFRNPYDNYIY